MLVHFEEFVLHLLQTTGHIVRALTLQFQGILTLAELLKTAPSTGLVMVTLGGVFPALTVTFTTLDVVERPRLSVATAVIG